MSVYIDVRSGVECVCGMYVGYGGCDLLSPCFFFSISFIIYLYTKKKKSVTREFFEKQ